jgi:predicted enzyme related to lactoylglutathione lyase
VAEGVFVWDELYTKDVEGAKRFYKALFDWDAETTDMGTGDYTIFSAGETQIAGCLAIDDEHGHVPSHWYPYIGAADVDATMERAKELGATVYMEPTDVQDMRFAILADPGMATFGLFKDT